MKDVVIIQVDSNNLCDYLNVITNADSRGTLVQLYKASHFRYVLLCWSSVIVLQCLQFPVVLFPIFLNDIIMYNTGIVTKLLCVILVLNIGTPFWEFY